MDIIKIIASALEKRGYLVETELLGNGYVFLTVRNRRYRTWICEVKQDDNSIIIIACFSVQNIPDVPDTFNIADPELIAKVYARVRFCEEARY